MEEFTSVESVLRRAIQLEEDAANLYTSAAQDTKNSRIRAELEELAEQEWGHKARIEGVLAGDISTAIRRWKSEPVTDLRLSDHLLGGSLRPNADYQDVLLFAIQREKAANEFYTAIGEQVDDETVRQVFDSLAAEELRHKYRLEKLYDDVVYQKF